MEGRPEGAAAQLRYGFFLSLPCLVISIDLIARRETDLVPEFVLKLPPLLLLYYLC